MSLIKVHTTVGNGILSDIHAKVFIELIEMLKKVSDLKLNFDDCCLSVKYKTKYVNTKFIDVMISVYDGKICQALSPETSANNLFFKIMKGLNYDELH